MLYRTLLLFYSFEPARLSRPAGDKQSIRGFPWMGCQGMACDWLDPLDDPLLDSTLSQAVTSFSDQTKKRVNTVDKGKTTVDRFMMHQVVDRKKQQYP